MHPMLDQPSRMTVGVAAATDEDETLVELAVVKVERETDEELDEVDPLDEEVGAAEEVMLIEVEEGVEETKAAEEEASVEETDEMEDEVATAELETPAEDEEAETAEKDAGMEEETAWEETADPATNEEERTAEDDATTDEDDDAARAGPEKVVRRLDPPQVCPRFPAQG